MFGFKPAHRDLPLELASLIYPPQRERERSRRRLTSYRESSLPIGIFSGTRVFALHASRAGRTVLLIPRGVFPSGGRPLELLTEGILSSILFPKTAGSSSVLAHTQNEISGTICDYSDASCPLPETPRNPQRNVILEQLTDPSSPSRNFGPPPPPPMCLSFPYPRTVASPMRAIFAKLTSPSLPQTTPLLFL